MKIRHGFVSNSSSSSFICMVSGECEGGYDLTLKDAGMVECNAGHLFYSHYVVQFIDADKLSENDFFRYMDENIIPSENCPICTLTHITDNDILKFVIKKMKFDKNKIISDIRDTCKDYQGFIRFLK